MKLVANDRTVDRRSGIAGLLESLSEPVLLKPVMPGDNRDVEPPDPMPNSVVKRVIADGSVGLPHVRVGHRQAPNIKEPQYRWYWGFFVLRRCEQLCATWLM